MPEDEEVEEDAVEEQENAEDAASEEEEEFEHPEAKGYACVNCEAEVELDPVSDKIICPKCSHRVLLKKRSENPDVVEAV